MHRMGALVAGFFIDRANTCLVCITNRNRSRQKRRGVTFLFKISCDENNQLRSLPMLAATAFTTRLTRALHGRFSALVVHC